MKVMTEPVRGCGRRSIGGLYLVGEGLAVPCDALPYELHLCPCCGSGIKFSRGFTWIMGTYFANLKCKQSCKRVLSCPFMSEDKIGLLWVGEQFYTTDGFMREAAELGVSKRIAALPKGLEIGRTWVLLAHKKAIHKVDATTGEVTAVPAIFYAFRPVRVEKLLLRDETTEEELEGLKKRGITPVLFDRSEVGEAEQLEMEMNHEDSVT